MNNPFILIPLVVFLILVFVLLTPIHIILEYTSGFKIRIRVLFINFQIYPNSRLIKSRPRKKRLSGSSKIKAKKSNPIKDVKKILYLIKCYIKPFWYTFKKILSRFKVHGLCLNASIASTDAAETAADYYKFKSLVHSGLAAILNIKSIENVTINIYPDFIAEQSDMEFRLDISARIWPIIYELVLFGFRYVKMPNKSKS